MLLIIGSVWVFGFAPEFPDPERRSPVACGRLIPLTLGTGWSGAAGADAGWRRL